MQAMTATPRAGGSGSGPLNVLGVTLVVGKQVVGDGHGLGPPLLFAR